MFLRLFIGLNDTPIPKGKHPSESPPRPEGVSTLLRAPENLSTTKVEGLPLDGDPVVLASPVCEEMRTVLRSGLRPSGESLAKGSLSNKNWSSPRLTSSLLHDVLSLERKWWTVFRSRSCICSGMDSTLVRVSQSSSSHWNDCCGMSHDFPSFNTKPLA